MSNDSTNISASIPCPKSGLMAPEGLKFCPSKGKVWEKVKTTSSRRDEQPLKEIIKVIW